MNAEPQSEHENPSRRRWMSILAKTRVENLEAAWKEIDPGSGYEHLRKPETGMVMVRARAGKTGVRFNLGEMTVSRAAIKLPDGMVGFGYVAGRNLRHAELAALFDAFLRDDSRAAHLMESFIEPWERQLAEKRKSVLTETASSRVDFFTMVRGDE